MTARRGARRWLSDLKCSDEETCRLQSIDTCVHGATTKPGQGRAASPRNVPVTVRGRTALADRGDQLDAPIVGSSSFR